MIDNPKTSVPCRDRQRQLAVYVGGRLRRAREAAGLSQLDAARLIGYANSTKLSKIETGRHTSQIPMWTLKRAAQAYGASLDYLLGVNGVNSDKAKAERIESLMGELHKIDASAIAELMNHSSAASWELSVAIKSLTMELHEARARNPQMADLNRLDAAVDSVSAAFTRHKGREPSQVRLSMQAFSNLELIGSSARAFQ